MMKYMTICVLSIFLIGISVSVFAVETEKMNLKEQSIATESAGEEKLIQEAKELPSTLMTGEENRSSTMQQVEELREGYVYDEDLQDD